MEAAQGDPGFSFVLPAQPFAGVPAGQGRDKGGGAQRVPDDSSEHKPKTTATAAAKTETNPPTSAQVPPACD